MLIAFFVKSALSRGLFFAESHERWVAANSPDSYSIRMCVKPHELLRWQIHGGAGFRNCLTVSARLSSPGNAAQQEAQMAGSKHPKLLPKAKKDIEKTFKVHKSYVAGSKKWIKDIGDAARKIAASGQEFKREADAMKVIFEEYKTKVEEIQKAEGDAKGSKDKSVLKNLKKLEGEADRLRARYNAGADTLRIIRSDVEANATIDSTAIISTLRV